MLNSSNRAMQRIMISTVQQQSAQIFSELRQINSNSTMKTQTNIVMNCDIDWTAATQYIFDNQWLKVCNTLTRKEFS